MVARMAKTSRCRKKCKKPEKPLLAGNPEEISPPYVPLYSSFMEKPQALIDLMQSIIQLISPPGQTADSFF
jgi:hypothetical protein